MNLLEEKQTVLIVEDDQLIRDWLSHIALIALGDDCIAVAFPDIEHPLNWIANSDKAPVLVITDWNIVDRLGQEIIQAVHAKWPEVPIILYTGTAHSQEEITKFADMGMTTYVTKPTSASRMVDHIIKTVDLCAK